jgi:hypothetical protein
MFDVRNVVFLSHGLMHIFIIIAFVSTKMLLDLFGSRAIYHDGNEQIISRPAVRRVQRPAGESCGPVYLYLWDFYLFLRHPKALGKICCRSIAIPCQSHVPFGSTTPFLASCWQKGNPPPTGTLAPNH